MGQRKEIMESFLNWISTREIKNRILNIIDAALKYCSSEAFHKATAIADEHPKEFLEVLLPRFNYAKPDMTYAALLLLEHLVSSCSYNFHVALARFPILQDKIVTLAIRRAEDESHRSVQRLSRLTLLEYSRIFADDKDLKCLSTLLNTFEKSTGKNLMRCLNIQKRKVKFKKVTSEDYVLREPSPDPSSPLEASNVEVGVRDLAPLKLSAAEVWPCCVCGYMNAPSGTRCAACETTRRIKTPLKSSECEQNGNEKEKTGEAESVVKSSSPPLELDVLAK